MARIKTGLEKLKLPFKEYLVASFFCALGTLLAVVLLQKSLPPEVPLFYGAAEGEAQLISSWGLTIPSIVSILVVFVNATLASLLKDDFTKKILVLMATVVTFFSVVTTFKIIFLVGGF